MSTTAHRLPQPAVLRWTVPKDSAYFNGHFPGFPLLPGVATLHEYVLPGADTCFPGLGALRRVERLKFRRPIMPGDEIELFMERELSGSVIRFEITRAGECCASGILVFGGGPSAAVR